MVVPLELYSVDKVLSQLLREELPQFFQLAHYSEVLDLAHQVADSLVVNLSLEIHHKLVPLMADFLEIVRKEALCSVSLYPSFQDKILSLINLKRQEMLKTKMKVKMAKAMMNLKRQTMSLLLFQAMLLSFQVSLTSPSSLIFNRDLPRSHLILKSSITPLRSSRSCPKLHLLLAKKRGKVMMNLRRFQWVKAISV